LPWGSHLCQFYGTKADLLEVLVPYFQAGLENNECCCWVVQPPLSAEEARDALGQAVLGLADLQRSGQIEILPRAPWTASESEASRAVMARLDQALIKGFDGLRLALHPPLPEEHEAPYPHPLGMDAIASLNVIAMFLYPRDSFDAAGLMEVVKCHRLALVRGPGGWEVLESSEALSVRHALKRTEEKLRSLFNNMSEGFAYHRIVLDPSGRPCDYVFLEVNEAFTRLTGLEADQIIGRRVTEALPGIEKDPVDWIGKYGTVALTGRPLQFESYSDALKRWFSVSAFSPHMGFFACTFADITERKRAEEKILHQTQVLGGINRIFQESLDCKSEQQLVRLCLSVAREVTGSQFGFIDEVDDSCRFTRIASSDPGQEACRTECRAGDDGEAEFGVMNRSLRERVIQSGRGCYFNEPPSDPDRIATPESDLRARAMLGVPLTQSGRIFGIVGVGGRPGGYRPEDQQALEALGEPILQVLMRRRNENERRNLEERLAVTLRSIGDAVLSVDDEGRVTFLNPMAVALTGWTESEGLGRPVNDVFRVVSETSGEPCEDIIRQALSERRVVNLANHTALVSRDGRRIPIEDSAAPIFSSDGQITGAVLVFHDVTAKRRAQRELQRSHEELENRVAERTAQLRSANVHIEARAAQLRALASELTLAEQRERRRIARFLHDNLQQLLVGAKLRVIPLNRSADESARDAGVAVSALLDEAIQSSRSLTAEISPPLLYEQGLVQALSWLARWIAEKHGLSVEVSSEAIPTQLEEGMSILLFESVREILFNVVKHAGVSEARVDVRCTDGKLLIAVVDRGSGFDPESVRSTGASIGGFGLFSIRERLGLLGGEMEIESAPGRGTRVTLIAPIRLSCPPSGQVGSAHIRILLVDDHPIMRDGLTKMFAQEPDIEVVGEASDGETAVELAAKLVPDVVLMDIMMSGLGGVEATRIIRERLPQVKIVGFSMLDDADAVRAMLAAGASAHLSKSGPAEELLRAVRNCVSAELHPTRP
jgi:PAS domain S-box-containing protein